MADRIKRGPGWLQSAINNHADEIEQNKPISGIGADVSDSPTGKGRSINAAGSAAGASVGGIVRLKKIDDEWVAGVSPDYTLLGFISAPDTPEEIEVEDKLTTGADDDESWMPTFENDYVWVEMTVTSLEVTSAYIQSFGLEAEFGGGEIEHDGSTPPVQSKARVVLAKIISDGAGGLKVKPFAGGIHRLGIAYGDAADSAGDNASAITAVVALAF